MTTSQTTHEISKEQVRQFVLAGNATFTIKNEDTGGRFTFKVTQPKNTDAVKYVSVLTGQNNETDYTWLGTIFNATGTYSRGQRSSIGKSAQSNKAFGWFMRHIDNLPAQVHVYHEGRCCRCGRKLTVPESIISGVGPECATKM